MIYINDQPLNVTLFPDNTSQVWKLPNEILEHSLVDITWEFQSESEFLQLAQLKTLLDHYIVNSRLILKYLPYGRQDKEVSNESTFALHTFANLLNSLNFEKVYCIDPHSKVASNLIDNFQEEYPVEIIKKIFKETESNVVAYPDKGAKTKYTSKYSFPYIFGEKIRDQLTGKITSYIFKGHPGCQNVLIVDDICDGGATFIILAKELYDAGAKEVNLFVSHGIFSKGIQVLKEAGIKRVFTTDGEVEETHNGFTYRRL